MIIPSFGEIKERAGSRYELVLLVSKRARKIIDGQKPLVDTEDENPVSIALEEVMDGSIKFGEKISDREYAKKIAAQRQKIIEELKKKYMNFSELHDEE